MWEDKMQLIRDTYLDDRTLGRLYLDDFECDTLEDVFRPGDIFKVKVRGQTAIPEGTYKVILDYSNRFQKILPHILNVPNFEGIRIHSGNQPQDTEGCILVGKRAGNHIEDSRITMNLLMERLEKITDTTIEIKNA